MTARDVLRTAWHNVGRRRTRTALAAMGVTVGIVVLVAMLSFGVGVRRETLGRFSQMGLEWVEVHSGTSGLSFPFPGITRGDRTLPASLVEEWRKRPDVVDLRTTILLPGSEYTSLRYRDKTLAISLYEQALPVSDPFSPEARFVAGRGLRPGEEGVIVLGQDVVMHLGIPDPAAFLGAEVSVELHAPRGEGVSFPFTVVGVTDAPYWQVEIGVKDRQKIKEWWFNDTDVLETQGYDTVSLRVRSIAEAQALADELSRDGFDVRTSKMEFDAMMQAFRIVDVLLSSVGMLALFVAAIGIANTMVMAIYERTREIGLLKALGASRGEIRALFVSEAACIGLLGGIAGVVVGWLLSLGLNRLALLFFHWQHVEVQGTFFVTTPGLVLLALAFGTAVGALAGLIPAGRAARMDPVQALRYE